MPGFQAIGRKQNAEIRCGVANARQLEPRCFLAQAGRCASGCIALLGYNSDMPSTTSSVADAFRTALDLFDTGLDLMRQNLRRSHPESGDAEIERLLRDWLLDRPGAESGDCPGRPVDVSVRLA